MKTLLRITFAAMLLTSLFSCEKATMEAHPINQGD